MDDYDLLDIASWFSYFIQTVPITKILPGNSSSKNFDQRCVIYYLVHSYIFYTQLVSKHN